MPSYCLHRYLVISFDNFFRSTDISSHGSNSSIHSTRSSRGRRKHHSRWPGNYVGRVLSNTKPSFKGRIGQARTSPSPPPRKCIESADIGSRGRCKAHLLEKRRDGGHSMGFPL
ncbi:hypothetical protein E4U14_000786 [Claviceps sp. LM454 group G7]|nr:hypothetical protein E4U14_000786 [Claviceps sp. LM454 group G7]